MAREFVLYEKRGRIAYITMNRPEVMNSLHAWANAEMYEIFCDFRDDPEVWIAIVTGAGERAFSAGNDLKVTAAMRAGTITRPLPPQPAPYGFAGLTRGFDCYKPIIAAVNGVAVGGGCEIALASDIVVAAEHARFGLPEPRVGLIAGSGGTHRLPRQIPLKAAMGLLLTGKQISAQEAYRIGLVNEVVPLSELIPAAERWANEILECAPINVRAIKEAILESIHLPLREAVQTRLGLWQSYLKSEDMWEGPRAFAEKRKPQWTGR